MSDAGPWVDALATVEALVVAGTKYQTCRRRIRVGTWQEPLPGVVCRTTGDLTPRQWMRAALLWIGPDAALSHASATRLWGLPAAGLRVIVTTSGSKHPRSTGRVWVRQSTRPYRTVLVQGLRATTEARSVLDAALDLRRLSDVDDLFGRALQAKLVTVDSLAEELQRAPSRGSRLPRLALADLAVGSHAASEAQLVRLLRAADLPMPELNAPVRTASGTRYVDALWRQLRRGIEIDGQAYHLDPASWRADLSRQNEIQSTGIVLLRIAARRLWTEPDAVVREIRDFLLLTAA